MHFNGTISTLIGWLSLFYVENPLDLMMKHDDHKQPNKIIVDLRVIQFDQYFDCATAFNQDVPQVDDIQKQRGVDATPESFSRSTAIWMVVAGLVLLILIVIAVMVKAHKKAASK